MKKIIILTIVTWLMQSNSFSQVVNDDCSNATNLGQLYGQWVFTGSACFNGTSSDTSFSGIIDNLVLPNYPYPQCPLSCEGYTSTIAAPARDLWYYIPTVSCDLTFILYANDTTHMSIWTGTNCTLLHPLNCFTLLPGGYISRTLSMIGSDIYLQISSSSVNSYSNFGLCLSGSIGACSPTYNYTDPTPLLCNNYY